MRNLVLLLIGMMLGAALFHVYYLRLDPLARCSWDHPLDAEAKARCRDAGGGNERAWLCRQGAPRSRFADRSRRALRRS